MCSLPLPGRFAGKCPWSGPAFVSCWVFCFRARSSMSDYVPSSSIRVFLLVENRLLREALVRLLRKRPDLNVVGQSSLAEDAVHPILGGESDVLVGDSFLPSDTLSILSASGATAPGCKILLVGMESDEEQFLASVRSGVAGYLLRDASA